MIKKGLLLIMLLVLLIAFSTSAFEAERIKNDFSSDYFIQNTYEETGSTNLVTGIYLDYRLFDSIFEASMLLISVTGIIFMSKRDDEIL